MLTKTHAFVLLASISSAAAYGCAVEDTDLEADESVSVDDEWFLEQRWQLNGDDPPILLDERWVTRSQQIRERELEEDFKAAGNADDGLGSARSAAMTEETLWCDSSDFRIWDEVTYQGNRLCLTGTGRTRLDLFCWRTGATGTCVETWDGHVHSFNTGTGSTGNFWQGSGSCCSQHCGTQSGAVGDASNCETNSVAVARPSDSCTLGC